MINELSQMANEATDEATRKAISTTIEKLNQ